MVGYTAKSDPKISARAIGFERDISPKKAVEVCRAVRGMKVPEAKRFLEDVMAKRRAVPYHRYVRSIGHRKGKGIRSGGYPVKVAKEVLRTIESAEQNAEYKGLDPEEMYIKVIAAHRGRKFENYIPRAHGRATPFFRETVNIEVILEQVEE